MASEADNLQTALNQVAQRIAEVTASSQPDYSINGRSISMGAYLAMLIQNREALKKALVDAQGPFEVRTVEG